MRAAIKNEIIKLFSYKKYTVFIIIGALSSVVWSFLGTMISSGLSLFSGQAMYMDLGFTPTAALPLAANLLLPLLIFMAASDLFTTEFADSSIKASLIRPIFRSKLYVAKVLAIQFYVTVYLAIMLAIGGITGLISGSIRTPGTFFTAMAAYALTLVPMLVLIVFSSLISLLFRSSALVMLMLIFAMLVFGALSFLVPITYDLVFTNYLLWYRLWVGSVPSFGRMLNFCLILFSYGAAFTLGGMMLFNRRDV
jgi:ABC-2 type transport system permease protein